MAKLSKAVFVKDPDRNGTVILLHPGDEPEPRLAALVTNPDAWEDGKLPTAAKKAAKADTADDTTASASTSDDGSGDKPAASKRQATSPARGRKAAGEGSSG